MEASGIALIGWEEKAPALVKAGDEVCFARHVLPRDEDVARRLTARWDEFGKPILLTVYGRVDSLKAILPGVWVVGIEIWQAQSIQPLGLGTEMRFGDWDVDGRTEEGPVMDFVFKTEEPLTVIRHTGIPV